MSHSFGCRLSLKAYGSLNPPKNINNRQFLFAPAVQRKSIQKGQKFYAASACSTTCHVFFTNNDGVLNLGGPVFLNRDFSLGTKGPPTTNGVTKGDRISDKVYGINCTNLFLHAKNKHSAYRSNQKVFEYIKDVVKSAPNNLGVKRFKLFHADNTED